MKICKTCNREIPKDALYCLYCGNIQMTELYKEFRKSKGDLITEINNWFVDNPNITIKNASVQMKNSFSQKKIESFYVNYIPISNVIHGYKLFLNKEIGFSNKKSIDNIIRDWLKKNPQRKIVDGFTISLSQTTYGQNGSSLTGLGLTKRFYCILTELNQ